MSDATILYSGVFCFTLILLALGFTYREFRNMSRRDVRAVSAPTHRESIETTALGRARP